MHLVTLDFETYWSQTHTLKKMPPLVYAMHKDTEIISLSATVGDEAAVCVFGEDEAVKLLQSLNIGKSLAVGHNMSGFDCYLMSNRLRFFPRLYGCTMAMARPHHAKTTGLSLGALVEHYGLGHKDQTALLNTRGKHLADFSRQELRDMAEYNKADTTQCRDLFRILRPLTSNAEMWAIDSTIRMRTEPKFVVDVPLLETALSVERTQKLDLLSQLALELGIERYNIDNDTVLTEDELMEQVRAMVASAPKFAAFLEQHGTEVPMKASPTNGAPIPALAKTDEGFLALLESDNHIVATAARCRLSQKSTLLETRIGKFLTAAECGGGYLHIPIKYSGADTTGRDSGEEFNPQNLPRISSDKSKPSNALRYSMKAPPGHVVMVADLSGIELRVNHFLWQVQGSMELYKADPEADLYRAFAATRYGVRPEEVSKEQRQLAKLCIAEGQLVLTDSGLVPIERVTSTHKVWDGVEWVATDGAAYMGEKEVIEYEGITTTPDHEVWTQCGRKVPIGHASAQSLRLMRTGAGGAPLGVGGANIAGISQGGQPAKGSDSLYRVLRGEAGGLLRAKQGQHPAEPAQQGADRRGDSGQVLQEVRQAKRRVWDLLNCGPRHRFTCQDVLVSNCQLGLGFGAGHVTFRKVAKTMGGLDLSDEDAQLVTNDWRGTYFQIVNGWKKCHAHLPDILAGREQEIDPWGLCHTSSDGIVLPSGRIIRYPDLRYEQGSKGKEWWYGQGRHKARIYAGKIDENIVQALARDVVFGNALDFFKETGLHPSLRVHDELVYVVEEAAAQELLDTLQAIMRTPPSWWPELITWSEGDIAPTYGDAK